ncbi:glycerophosphodiester phosphodiesterase [Rhizobium lemnae]|uniref:Glycerophosphodiester phosphodiesterase n=1 Tax=Rhizobium lemnae TaxID=1214924 RepID=A0ABV8E493_9HYPH|nr:glycerophosphodiester phosphodiesterase family protein [Rhizobium lemnae]MCJ8507499.1 glycerophosphodiester phosphodiesterase [Rhizobium lemnae]
MTRLLSHRGYSALYRENSPSAWIAAVDAGADGIEIDVRRSRDGVFVCAHDPDLRLASYTGLINDMTSEQIQAYQAAGEPAAPKLDLAFKMIPQTTEILLDIKDERPDALHDLLVQIKNGSRDNITLGLHSLNAIRCCRTRFSGTILGLLSGEEKDDIPFFEEGGDILRLWESMTSLERISRLRAGHRTLWMTVGGWGTDREVGDFDATHLRKMKDAGIAGFLVNDPPAARRALNY